MKLVRFSGAGNTFFLADNRTQVFDTTCVQQLCCMGRVDGLILVENSEKADARMRIYNRDGSEAEMCGNGLRCLTAFLGEIGIERSLYHIETAAGLHSAWVTCGGVCVKLPPPHHMQLHIKLNLHFINTGVPHGVLFFPDIEDLDLLTQGKMLRASPVFGPAGANINFAQLNRDGSLSIRTYERGIEGETLACGTGAVACALIAHKIYQLPSPITVHVKSGEKLKISFLNDWSEVTMEGPVRREQDHVLEIKNQTLTIHA